MCIRQVNVWGTFGIKGCRQINEKLKFLYWKNNFLTPALCRMLRNSLIQPHFDYACIAWYPHLTKKKKKRYKLCKINICSFVLDEMQHLSLAEFRSINWLSTKQRVHQCIIAITFKFVNKNCPFYLNEIFEFALHCRRDTRNSLAKLKHPFHKTNMGQKTLSCIGPSLWNNLHETIKKTKNFKLSNIM